MHSNLFCVGSLQDQNTALHLAAKNGHAEVLQKIVETGVDVDEKNIVSYKQLPIGLQ